ncbi:hypothetical protein DY000_02053268 [Brassica cretica]|uniref:Uncharacterized protein n=1 Tax=Brassica cretica TaxID=69181 RepID=A0ABQ7AA78_BRACR|nr:hypothetical protein DY000_02053268 [Brassica cretica]
MGITSYLTVGLTSNQWHSKASSKLYLVSKDQLNFTVGRSASISEHLTRLCSSALKRLQKAPKSPLSSKMYITNLSLAQMWHTVRPTIKLDPTPKEQADIEQHPEQHNFQIFDDTNLNI